MRLILPIPVDFSVDFSEGIYQKIEHMLVYHPFS
jgi:hypothetical protein